MGLAIKILGTATDVNPAAFSSLFIGMGLAIRSEACQDIRGLELSVPFSSGWALQWPLKRADLA